MIWPKERMYRESGPKIAVHVAITEKSSQRWRCIDVTHRPRSWIRATTLSTSCFTTYNCNKTATQKHNCPTLHCTADVLRMQQRNHLMAAFVPDGGEEKKRSETHWKKKNALCGADWFRQNKAGNYRVSAQRDEVREWPLDPITRHGPPSIPGWNEAPPYLKKWVRKRQLNEKGLIHIREAAGKSIMLLRGGKKNWLEKNEGDGRMELRKIRVQRRSGGPINLRAPKIKINAALSHFQVYFRY